ncbi:MAG: AAA family ATPase [Gemmatimonadaceae bacterium]|nr:AAA family ATPase [Gemmatimonadaceae bacterium]
MTDRSRSSARLLFMGGQRIEIGSDVVTPESERLFGMLVRLSVPLGRITSRQTMLETIWPGVDDANGRHNLRQTVYKAREIGLVVESSEDGLRLDPRHWTCDWDDPPFGDIAGEWLRGYEPAFSEELAGWIATQRTGVHALIRPRIIRALQTARSAGDLLAADRHAQQLLDIDTLNEEATLTRAELMAMQGAKVDALKLLDAYLAEMGVLSAGRDAALPAQLLRRRIAEKLPAVSYLSVGKHHGPLVGRQREAKRLTAALFDARAGRGAGVLVYGPDGSGKSRLLHEVRKSAVLQGMRVMELPCGSAPDMMPFATVRLLVGRLLDCPGAMGVAPEALDRLRRWLASNEFAPTDCPLAEIEDLLAAVSEETPLLLLVEQVERMDAESLVRLDRVYRRGVLRHHVMLLTTPAAATPLESPVELQWIERVPLRPLRTTEVRAILAAYAEVEQPHATSDQVAFASVFSEGIPMYGIEMLGLMLDHGSPDVIPFRVQVALDRALRELTELQCRLLALCGLMGACARQPHVATALQATPVDLTSALDGLEQAGYLQCEEGVLRASGLLSVAAEHRLKPNVLRMDALRATEPLLADTQSELEPATFYICLRLLIVSGEEARARALIDVQAGTLLRRDTAASVVWELAQLRELAKSERLKSAFKEVSERVNGGAQNVRPSKKGLTVHHPMNLSLPSISSTTMEMAHSPSSDSALSIVLARSRQPDMLPRERLAEAVMAMFMASNIHDLGGLDAAFRAVEAVRHCADVNPFDVHRADLIYHASLGNRRQATESAWNLVAEARVVQDVHLACTGLRNAAAALSYYGDSASAQGLLLESRMLAFRLGYHAQIMRADTLLGELCLSHMDLDGARAYLDSAEKVMFQNDIRANLLCSDLYLFQCWRALLEGDVVLAQRNARSSLKIMARPTQGTALCTYITTRLATHTGARTRQSEKSFQFLKQSIGSRPFYEGEQMAMAALLLYAKDSDFADSTAIFVQKHCERICKEGGFIWEFLASLALSSYTPTTPPTST